MTREEAIDLLDNLVGMVEDNHKSDYDTALQMAIKALEELPKRRTEAKRWKAMAAQSKCEDAISRQEVVESMCKWCSEPYCPYRDNGTSEEWCFPVGAVMDMPSINGK